MAYGDMEAPSGSGADGLDRDSLKRQAMLQICGESNQSAYYQDEYINPDGNEIDEMNDMSIDQHIALHADLMALGAIQTRRTVQSEGWTFLAS